MGAEGPELPPRPLLYQLCALVSVAYAVWMLRSGIHTGADTQTYSRWADQLIAMHFDIAAYLREQSFVVPPVFYIGWIALVAALKVWLGSSWMTGVVVLNWLSLSAGVYLSLAAIRTLTASSTSMMLAALLFIVAGDLLLFAPYVLSDLIYWGLSTAVLVAAVHLAIADDARRMIRTVLGGSALLMVALAFRPTTVPLALLWVAAVIAVPARPLMDRVGWVPLGCVAAAAAVAMAVHGQVLMNPDAWPFGPLPDILSILSDEYRRGVLVYAPESELIVDPATTWLGAVRLTIQKLVFLLTPWLPHYSVAHTLINLAFFVPAYGMSVAALTNAARLSAKQRRATYLLAGYVLLVSVFHAMVQIEYDHRYRLPMLPALIMLAAIGLESVRRPRTLASIARTP